MRELSLIRFNIYTEPKIKLKSNAIMTFGCGLFSLLLSISCSCVCVSVCDLELVPCSMHIATTDNRLTCCLFALRHTHTHTISAVAAAAQFHTQNAIKWKIHLIQVVATLSSFCCSFRLCFSVRLRVYV